jgi:hypothetical protein
MMTLAKFATVLGLLSLSACATKPMEVTVAPIEKPLLVLPGIDSVEMRGIKWVIVTPENAAAVFEQLKKNGTNPVLFALTDDGYQALSLNFADIQRYINDKNGAVIGYKDYYEKPKN